MKTRGSRFFIITVAMLAGILILGVLITPKPAVAVTSNNTTNITIVKLPEVFTVEQELGAKTVVRGYLRREQEDGKYLNKLVDDNNNEILLNVPAEYTRLFIDPTNQVYEVEGIFKQTTIKALQVSKMTPVPAQFTEFSS